MRLPTKGDNSSAPAPEHRLATRDTAARIRKFLGWEKSRFAQDVGERNGFAGGVFRLGVAMELVKFAGGGVCFHLLVPIVVRERMQQRLQLAPLLRREFLDGRPDFSNRAHAGKLSAIRNGVNEANHGCG